MLLPCYWAADMLYISRTIALDEKELNIVVCNGNIHPSITNVNIQNGCEFMLSCCSQYVNRYNYLLYVTWALLLQLFGNRYQFCNNNPGIPSTILTFCLTNNSETTSRKQCFFLFMSLVKINTLSCASLLGPLLSLIKLTITARNGESKIEGKSSETMQKMCLCLHLSPSCRDQPANQRARCVVFGRSVAPFHPISVFFCVHALQDEQSISSVAHIEY